ncbi:MAG: histidinol phosphate phosphatase [Blastocatellia bacterium]|nr:histidinol phosphate phosphatase [Blastocatellia bacterium]
MKTLESFFPILYDLSRQAGEIVRRYYYSQFEVEIKEDDSPVTRADREVEQFLRDSLEKLFPDYSILGEEFGETRKAGANRWIIDPIDGTKSFVMRTPLFGTMIALERDGCPVLGSIYFPIQDELLIGSAETGTFLNGASCSVSQTTELSRATMIVTDPRSLLTPDSRLYALSQKVRIVRGFGDCYGYSLVARGLADVMIEPAALKYYDVAPMPPILEGAGGVFSTLKGDLDFASGQGLAANRPLHDEIMRLFKQGELSA